MANSATTGLADRVIEGQKVLAEMRTSAGLRTSAAVLAERIDRLGCRDLFPASSNAEGVAAVVVALNEGLRVVTLTQITNEHLDKVVVVEAVAISGMKVRRAVNAVRDAGGSWVSAVVLHDLDTSEDDDGSRFGPVDELASAS
jgi:hypothetical protein